MGQTTISRQKDSQPETECHGSDTEYNYAYLDESTKGMIRRAILKA
ncbi:alpha-D-ribose 1-methylphosphonate 5-phosphate C-P-lyase PhnJ, partial [Pectobacterium brasiliense]